MQSIFVNSSCGAASSNSCRFSLGYIGGVKRKHDPLVNTENSGNRVGSYTHQSAMMCLHRPLEMCVCFDVWCFAKGGNVFFFLAADAIAVHMRITLNFWGNILSRRWAVGSLPLDSAPSGGHQTRSPTVKENVVLYVEKHTQPPVDENTVFYSL